MIFILADKNPNIEFGLVSRVANFWERAAHSSMY